VITDFENARFDDMCLLSKAAKQRQHKRDTDGV